MKIAGFLTGIVSLIISSASATPPDLEQFFAIPSVRELPLKIEILSETHKDGVKTTELYLNGAPFNGKPTKIYAWYSTPSGRGPFPAVLQLHGSGLQKLSPDPSIFYAKNGFACISIDWAPPSEKRKNRQSAFESEGRMTKFGPGFQPLHLEKDYLRNGVMFSRRALDFLRSRPEVDRGKLMVSGASAGAWHTLLLTGLEKELKAVAVKYGAISGIDFGYFTGVFGPLKMVNQKGYQEKWLSHFDAANLIPKCKAAVLMLSGTDDIFYAMPVVLETFRRIPSEKKLLMRPNDNHQLVGNETIPLAYFQSVLKQTPEWPEVSIRNVRMKDGKLQFTLLPVSRNSIKQLSILYKTEPRGLFEWKKNWKKIEAVRNGNQWTAELGTPPRDTQTVAYALLEDTAGRSVSSDTIEIPDFPKWRGKPGIQHLDDGNLFFNPSFELGPRLFNLRGGPRLDTGGKEAHSGKSALCLTGGKSWLTTWSLPKPPGQNFCLKVWAKSTTPDAKLAISIRWSLSNRKNKLSSRTFPLSQHYRQCSFSGPIPKDAVDGYLTIRPLDTAEIWIDDLYYNIQ